MRPSSFLFSGHSDSFNRLPLSRSWGWQQFLECPQKLWLHRRGPDTIEQSRKGAHIWALWNTHRSHSWGLYVKRRTASSGSWYVLPISSAEQPVKCVWAAPDFYTRQGKTVTVSSRGRTQREYPDAIVMRCHGKCRTGQSWIWAHYAALPSKCLSLSKLEPASL